MCVCSLKFILHSHNTDLFPSVIRSAIVELHSTCVLQLTVRLWLSLFRCVLYMDVRTGRNRLFPLSIRYKYYYTAATTAAAVVAVAP